MEHLIVEVSWGCPSKRYPLNGLFQFDQAKALSDAGENIVFLALDMRSVRKWRKWGIVRSRKDGICVYEYNFPYGPMSPEFKYRIQDRCFEKSINAICAEQGMPACVHFHGVMEAISGMKWCMEHHVPYVITEHITPVKEGDEVHRRMTDAYRNADRIICVSNKLASDIKTAYGADTDAVIPNIVDLSLFEYSPDISGEGYRFISAAGLNAGKGFDVLLKAFGMLVSDVLSKEEGDIPHLTIMGDGVEKSRLKDLAESLGVAEYVTFTGEYIRSEFAEELRRSDCFVLASRSETFGIVYAEAMAAGVPVIATRCGGPEDFVDSENGMLVPVGDASALAEAMTDMMSVSGEYDGQKISERCRNRFAPGTIAEKVRDVIRQCVSV